jgi:hypothetical protein
MVQSISSAQIALSLLPQSSSGGFNFASLYLSSASGAGTGVWQSPQEALSQAEKNETKQLEQTAKSPEVQRDLDRYAKVVANAKTLDDVLDDPVARRVFLKANGLGDQADYVGLVKKALMSDPNDSGSLANKLSSINVNWLETVKRYDFANSGLDRLRPNNVGFTGDWSLTLTRDGKAVETDLEITKTAKGGWKAAVNGTSAGVTVDGDTITVNFVWKDTAQVAHLSSITGKVGKDGRLSGAQEDDGDVVGKWSATPYYADAIKAVGDDYVAEKRLDNLDEQMPGLGSAILFKKVAKDFKSTIGILGSALGREVVTTALGLPKQIALQSLEAQTKAIDQRLDVKKLQDPAFVDKLVQRYLIQLNGGTSGLTA